jgi:uncharacterized pyridoxal phosphate-dependent enzyme
MISRRRLLTMVPGLALFGGVAEAGLLQRTAEAASRIKYRNYFRELGVPEIINARGHNTIMTGSLMLPEVKEAIAATSTRFVDLEVLQDRAGERIAELVGCEAAMVTSGAAGALTLGTAACVTGMDRDKISALPSLPGPQREVIVQRTHRVNYDHAIRNTGIRMIEVESRRELEDAVNENTVMMFYLNRGTPRGQIEHEEFVELGRRHGIPTFIDCAAELPPVDNLWRFIDLGFDLVTFSGGKELRGPQSSGLLLGRRDLIAAAREQSNPKADTIGRGMKVNKEEIVGMLIAVETFLKMDHDQVMRERMERARYVGEYVKSLPGVSQEVRMNTEGYVGEVNVPVLHVTWDQAVVRRTPPEVLQALRDGHPSIVVGGESQGVSVNLRMENPGTERVVARRLYEELSKGYLTATRV